MYEFFYGCFETERDFHGLGKFIFSLSANWSIEAGKGHLLHLEYGNTDLKIEK